MSANIDPTFRQIVSQLPLRHATLLACKKLQFGGLPTDMPKSGVYLFSEGETHLYVGRSNRLRDRYFLHCRPGSRQNQASFAYKLACEALDTFNVHGQSLTRQKRSALPEFALAFEDAKRRIRSMDYRYVAEPDQVNQALLEAYCVISLSTLYNDFETH